MKIEKPMCNFQNCKYHQDGNCVDASRYENCKLTDLHSEIARLRVDLDNVKADTVRKMQERFSSLLEKEYKENTPEGSDHYFRNGSFMMWSIADRVFDKIAKELIEKPTE